MQDILYQPAARERVGDSSKGVSIQGFLLLTSHKEPIVFGMAASVLAVEHVGSKFLLNVVAIQSLQDPGTFNT